MYEEENTREAAHWKMCQERLPPSLAKAVYDSFEFMVVLRSGYTIWFETAEYSGGDYITLRRCLFGKANSGAPIVATGGRLGRDDAESDGAVQIGERGIDVRIDDIVLAMDAPWGS